MNNKEFIEINKKGWNDLIKSNKPFSNTILPEYGPFLKRNEEETILKDDVNGYKSTFWKKEKTINCPSTIIFKFKKYN